MELEDLKQQWKATGSIHTPQNKNIMEMIQHKSYGPVAALKRSFRKQFIAMTVIPIAIIAVNMQNADTMLRSAMFWSYMFFCFGVLVFARMNYRIVQKMERMDGMVKPTLEQQVSLLETRVKQNLAGVRIALLFFITLTEVLPYLQHFRMLDKWHSLSPFIRFGAYAGLVLLQYFVSRNVSYRKFGQHIAYLKELLKQAQ
jgi:hypothetical protein